MSEASHLPQPSLEELAGQLRSLTERVDRLTGEVTDLARRVADQSLPSELGVVPLAAAEDGTEPELVVQSLNAPAVLTNVAVVCFLLVVALILRTIVDSGVVDQSAGFVAGIGYAGLLLAYGGYLYAQRRPAAPVFAISGELLGLSIIFESHTLFEIVSTPAAYLLLLALPIPVTVWGLRYHATAACFTGVIGAGICGIAIEFPEPTYSWLSGLLLLVNACAFVYLTGRHARVLLTVSFLVTMLFSMLWLIKARSAIAESEIPLESVYLPWAIPVLGAFALVYLAASIRLMLRHSGRLGPVELALPTLNALWAYGAAQGMLSPWFGRSDGIAIVGVLVAAGHLALCAWFARRSVDRELASTSFAVAGVSLLIIALPACTPTPYWAVAAWSFVGLGLAVAAGYWKIKALRFLSYLVQIAAVIAAASWGMMAEETPFPAVKWALLAFTFGCTSAQFYWCRLRRPLSPTPLFRVVSVLTSLACIAYLFGAARIVLYTALTDAFDDAGPIFLSGQSLILNGMAAILMLVALRWKNLEILITSTIVACVAAAKVFGYDFVNTADVPRVLSVASSGATAAFGSYVWSAWQRHRDSPEPVHNDDGE